MSSQFINSRPDLFREPLPQPRKISVQGKPAVQLGWIKNADGRRLFAEITYGNSFVVPQQIDDAPEASQGDRPCQ